MMVGDTLFALVQEMRADREVDRFGENALTRLRHVMRELSDVPAKYAEALEDGVVTADEKEALLSEIRQAERALAGLKESLGDGA